MTPRSLRRRPPLAGARPGGRRRSAAASPRRRPLEARRAPRLPADDRRSPRGPVAAISQMELDFGAAGARWTFSRLVARSPHFARILRRVEFVRRHFPELETVSVRVGLAQKRGVLGWGSLDPHHPAIWVRPRKLDYFTVAHELTHLLQARGMVPRGERACDLHALARSPALVDSPPSYLKLPLAMRRRREWEPAWGTLLHRAARRATEARAAGERHYLRQFEREVEVAFRLRLVPGRRDGGPGS